MSMLETFKSDSYEDGRTKQSFKDSTDINKILYQAQRTGTISHLQAHGGIYGDFSDIDDLLTAHARLERGKEVFDQLPSEIKREFDQDVGAFFRFVNDPANKDDLAKLLPAIAKQGDAVPDIGKKIAQATGGASIVEPVEVTPTESTGTEEAPSEGA